MLFAVIRPTVGVIVNDLTSYPGDLGPFLRPNKPLSLCVQRSNQHNDWHRYLRPITSLKTQDCSDRESAKLKTITIFI